MRDPRIYFVTHPMKEPPYKSAPAGTRISIPKKFGTTNHRAVTYTKERWKMLLGAVKAAEWEIGVYIDKI